MKGQEPTRIQQAVRQGQMHTDFLILLVNRTNYAILSESRSRWLEIALLYEQLRNASLAEDDVKQQETLKEWATMLRTFTTDLLSLQAASGLIRDKYFDGSCILLKDAEGD